MDDSQMTRLSLLVRIKDLSDTLAWSEFAEIYTPVLYGFLRRRGLQDADTADVTQEVFRAVARSIRGFDCDRQKGSFRNWLLTVARSKLMNFLASRQGEVLGSADSAVHRQLESQPATESEYDAWEQEYRRSVFDWAVSQIRDSLQESTWRAFWETSVEGKGIREVAEALGMSEGAVYVARCRVLAQIKKKIQQVEET